MAEAQMKYETKAQYEMAILFIDSVQAGFNGNEKAANRLFKSLENLQKGKSAEEIDFEYWARKFNVTVEKIKEAYENGTFKPTLRRNT